MKPDPRETVAAVQPSRLTYPLIAIHQLFVAELVEFPRGGPWNGLTIPDWLFQRAGLKRGEKVTLTREHCCDRPVDAINNRTTAPVFSAPDTLAVRAVGPTAAFLAAPGPSCCIAYAFPRQAEPDGLDLSFPDANTENAEQDLVVRRCSWESADSVAPAPVPRPFDGQVYRDLLVASLSGLTVHLGEISCNPMLAQVPVGLLTRAGLPAREIEAYFSSPNRRGPALRSYLVPSYGASVAMSGALFGAFPIGETVTIDVYGRFRTDEESNANFVHVA